MTDEVVVIKAPPVARTGENVALGTFACPCGCGWLLRIDQSRRDEVKANSSLAVLETTVAWARS